MMAVQLILDSITLALILSGVVVGIGGLIASLFIALSRKSWKSSKADAMYIGGEDEGILQRRVPSADAFYWGIVKRAWKDAFRILRDVIHSGRLNEWMGYMSMWFGFLVLVALLAVMVWALAR